MRKYWYSCCERYRPTNACQTNKNSKEQENPLKHTLVLRISNQNSSRTLPWIGRTSNFDHFVQSLILIKIRGVLSANRSGPLFVLLTRCCTEVRTYVSGTGARKCSKPPFPPQILAFPRETLAIHAIFLLFFSVLCSEDFNFDFAISNVKVKQTLITEILDSKPLLSWSRETDGSWA